PSFDFGDALIGEALDIAESLGDPALRGSCLVARSLHRIPWTCFAESAGLTMQAAELFRSLDSRWEESVVLGFTYMSLAGAGRFTELREVAEYLEPLADRLGNGAALMQCRRTKGMMHFVESGDPEALEA